MGPLLEDAHIDNQMIALGSLQWQGLGTTPVLGGHKMFSPFNEG